MTSIYTLFSTLFDRVLFTVCFIAGVQLPEFIQQYGQRLSGHLNEARRHLEQFQYIANVQYEGSLSKLVDNYLANNDEAIQQTGELVTSLQEREALLQTNMLGLQDSNYVNRILNFFEHLDTEMAQATFQQYVLAIPIEVNALITGLVVALIVILTKATTVYCCKKCGHAIAKKVKGNKIKEA